MKGIYRRVDNVGRIVLPVQIRNKLGIRENDRLEFSMNEKTAVIQLKKVGKTCLRCGSSQKLTDIVIGYSLCDTCLEGMIKTRQRTAE